MSEKLAGGWDLVKLAGRSPEDRHNIWRNAHAKGTPEALALARFIEESGLDYSQSGGISMSDPRVLEIREIIESTAGIKACIAATEKGLPALAGVEPMIVEKMGFRYGSFSLMTLTAGSIVGEVMRRQGYDKADLPRDMPSGSVAQTAAFWMLKGR